MSAIARQTEVPTLEHVLTTLAYHLRCIAVDKPTRKDPPYCNRLVFGMGMGGYGLTCPLVLVENIEITPASTMGEEDPWGVWAHVRIPTGPDHPGYSGNRAGAGDAYAKVCAPVIAWVAAYWAAKK
jgi:hypothetical protein